MNATAMQFVEILSSIEKIDASSLLTEGQKNQILKDMHFALPADFYCVTCVASRKIVETLLLDRLKEVKKQQEIQLGKPAKKAQATRKSPKKDTYQAANGPTKGK